MSELQVTSLDTLKEYSKGSLVELPPFGEGQPFVARLQRPSMFYLIKAGKIPNSLITQANKLFSNGTAMIRDQTMKPEMLDNLFTILDAVCEGAFLEPTYKQIKESGIHLTDQQKMFVFSYAQSGVEALESFRK